MVKTKHINTAWQAYAYSLIARLRQQHGVLPAGGHEESELDHLFKRFHTSDETADDGPLVPSRYVPARELLMVIRFAATIGSIGAGRVMRQCGALTVINDVPRDEIVLLKDVLKICFPRDQLVLVAPEISEGAVSKHAHDRFVRLIAESLDRIEPVLILQPEGLSLPRHLKVTAVTTFPMARITQDVVLTYLCSGHLADEMASQRDPKTLLPEDPALRRLSAIELCVALRAPDLATALQQLGELAQPDPYTLGPRLEDMEGDSPALAAARRLVADLQLWRAGTAGWHELSRSVLLYGPPGTGKTHLARAMGNSAGLSVVTASFGEWQACGHLGDMLRAMRTSFSQARAQAPCLLVIDEIDAVGSRSDDDRHASNYRIQVINCFLAEMDSIARQEGVIVVGTANHIERMDPAVVSWPRWIRSLGRRA
nr:ATP-binding protein [Marivita sp. GX14005]